MSVTISAAQYPITEHASFSDWAAYIENWVSEAVIKGSQLVVFPEYGSMELVSIFTPEIRTDIRRQVKKLDSLKDDFCSVFAELAKKYKTIIVAPSIPVIHENRNVNRVYVFSENGLVGYQDKLFMTRFENEEWGIESGEKTLTLFETSWGSFGIQICYDVEFGIGSQLLSSAGATLIIVPSCTETIRGATRVHIGTRARALENQVYTVVSQTVGNAEWSPAVDINYGYSAFYSTPDTDLPEEGIVSTMAPQQEGWLTTELDFSKIQEVRANGQVFNFKDQQKIETNFTDQEIRVIRKSI
ncbi:carbon-nitrogen hydrolase family protein [Dyadobacter sp. CY312]|uniref:carbon-nitrogen hydrolase family protein n=1 Tax=Dyadobacter sp. CY312 TaxID=2907303 RepID=UPI001F2DF781|nr:carbon-nitrogen hydrolase family protein [Dyadobacter sp. CY312]MCE7041036.1 carbon-nitrogen hydrolase family protein [Dyadobacter sp. CY312]